MTQPSMSLKYEPSSEPLHISVKQLFLNSRRARNLFVGDVAFHARMSAYPLQPSTLSPKP